MSSAKWGPFAKSTNLSSTEIMFRQIFCFATGNHEDVIQLTPVAPFTNMV